jgi:folylpolyglutamate synthase/dihydropteroate synthase
MGLAPGTSRIPNTVALPGRLERVMIRGRRVLIDGGHTPLAARRLAEAMAPDLPGGVRILLGILADKDASSVLAALDAQGVHLVCTTAPAARALPAEVLATAWTPQFATLEIKPSFEQAIADGVTCPEALLVIAGSLRMAAAARESLGMLEADALEEARRTRSLFEGEAYRQRWQR